MKKGILVGIIGGLMLMGGWLIIDQPAQEEIYYQARSESKVEEGAAGAAAYLNSLRANPQTGVVEMADVKQAREEFAALASRQAKQADYSWEEVGPTDEGGRSRAIIFDKDNPNIMYAGSVSGGIFKSTNGGLSWNVINDQLQNLSISCLAQGSDGTIYAGTGEALYASLFGYKSSTAFLGAGIYRSTDGGQTFSLIPSTDPSSGGFQAVGKIEVDPDNAQRVYACTDRGFQISDDGGDTWQSALPGSPFSTDMFITPSGTVYAKHGSAIYKSTSGDIGTYTEITGTDIPRNSSRMRVAVSPQDENYVYVVSTNNGAFDRLYQSTDGGQSFRVVGQRSAILNPHRNQGGWNNAIVVDPKDKERVLIGGVTVHEWSEENGWLNVATNNRALAIAGIYIHSDNHLIKFHPTKLNQIYIANDGGLTRSLDNGDSWNSINKGYATIQFYGIDVALDGKIMGGTQDNSNILIDPFSTFPTTGSYRNSGDGGEVEFSHLNPDYWFLASQYGNLRRSIRNGEQGTFDGFFSRDVTGARSPGSSLAFANFVTPFDLHEELRDPQSADSIRFGADTIATSIGFGNGGVDYTGSFTKPQSSTKFVAESFVIESGNQVVTSDAQGNLSGDGTGTFDANTGNFSVTFNAGTNLEILITAATTYDPGAPVTVLSLTNELPIRDTLVNGLQPGEEIMIQDPVQAIFAVGLTAYQSATEPNNKQGGVWMTRGAVREVGTPEWWHVGELNDEEVPSSLTISPDGNTIWVGTLNGRLIRISNLDQARSEETADIDDDYSTGNPVASTSVVTQDVALTLNRTITDIAVDPGNTDRVVVTVGGYGSNPKVYYTTNGNRPGISGSDFVNVTGNLPGAPAYATTFNYNDPNGGEVLIGNDFGVFKTDDIDASTVSWSVENQGLANVPVFDFVQTRTVRYDLKTNQDFEGQIYAATHGRGIFMTNSTADYVGNEELEPVAEGPAQEKLTVYPNPAVDRLNIKLQLEQRSAVRVEVRDLSGKTVLRHHYPAVAAHTEALSLEVGSLKTGAYIITVSYAGKSRSTQLLISK